MRTVTVTDRRELPPISGVRYVGFVDPSGGSQDSLTLAVAHLDGVRAVLDAVRETRPLFSPDSVVKDYADLLHAYRITTVTGDRYAGQWVAESFAKHGIGTGRPSYPRVTSIANSLRRATPVASSCWTCLCCAPNWSASNAESRVVGAIASITKPARGTTSPMQHVARW